MAHVRSPRLRLIAGAAALLVAAAGMIGAPAAVADTAPASGVPATVASDVLPTPQVDGIVWSQVIVGRTVYVGGSFSAARPAGAAPGTSTVKRSNLMAFDIETGVMTGFAPILNGQVRSLAASPDGKRLYAVGEFTTVDTYGRSRIAAFDTATGGLVPSFRPVASTRVNAVVATNDAVYLGGWFMQMNYSFRPFAAAVSASTGALLPFFPKVVGGTVQAITISPDGSKVVLGGNFTSLNGSGTEGLGLGAVSASSGSSLPFAVARVVRDGGQNSGITSLTSDGTSVYGTGYNYAGTGNLEGAFRARWSDGALEWIEDCHGDSYSIAPTASVVYTASHAHYCGNVGGFYESGQPGTGQYYQQRAMAFTKNAVRTVTRNTQDTVKYTNWEGRPAPDVLDWWPTLNAGTVSGQGQAAWSVVANNDYVVLGGEFTTVNGRTQQGIVRFGTSAKSPDDDGPQVSGSAYLPTVVSVGRGAVRVLWRANYDRDNTRLTYEVIRDGATATPVYTVTGESRTWFDQPIMAWLDTGATVGRTHSYRIRVTDPHGNAVSGSDVSVVAASTGVLSPYKQRVLQDGPAMYYRLSDTGATILDSMDRRLATATATTRGVPGAIPGDRDTAMGFDGSRSVVATGSRMQGRQQFAIEAWIKTTSTSGGTIMSFGDAGTGDSTVSDRDIYMDAAGRISFGTGANGYTGVKSSASFNDGRWHHVVASLDRKSMALHVDGVTVGSRSDYVSARDFVGYWRIGGDRSQLGHGYFAGSIDEVAIYDRPVSVALAKGHYDVGRTGGLAPVAPVAPVAPATQSDGLAGVQSVSPETPASSVPVPVTPAPEPVTPAPEPVTPAVPVPVTPAPLPATPAPDAPITAVAPAPATGIPAPAAPLPVDAG
jgi:hypothetical protein